MFGLCEGHILDISFICQKVLGQLESIGVVHEHIMRTMYRLSTGIYCLFLVYLFLLDTFSSNLSKYTVLVHGTFQCIL